MSSEFDKLSDQEVDFQENQSSEQEADEDSQLQRELPVNHMQKRSKFYFHQDLLKGLGCILIGLFILFIMLDDQSNGKTKGKTKAKIDFGLLFWVLIGFMFVLTGLSSYWYGNLRKYVDSLDSVNNLKESYRDVKYGMIQLVFVLEYLQKGSKDKKVLRKITEKVSIENHYDQCGSLEPTDPNTFSKPIIFVDYELQCQLLDSDQQNILNTWYEKFVKKHKEKQIKSHRYEFWFNRDQSPTIRKGYFKKWNVSWLKYFFHVINFFMLIWPCAVILQFFVEKYTVPIKKKVKIATD